MAAIRCSYWATAARLKQINFDNLPLFDLRSGHSGTADWSAAKKLLMNGRKIPLS
jgi:hypothetical protein